MARADIYHYCETQPEYDPEWHWITDQIAMGSYPLQAALDELLGQGINAIVSVRWDEPDYDLDLFEDAHIGCVEDGCPFPYDQLTDALRFIHRNVQAGRKVYVHCFAGVSRSAFVVACYLMLTGDISFTEAVSTVRAIRARVDPHTALWDREMLDRLRSERDAILARDGSA